MSLENDLDAVVGALEPAVPVAPATPARLQRVAQPVTPVTDVLAQFERCKPWLQEALDGGHHTIEEVARDIANQTVQFWPGKACAVVTRVHSFPTGKACQVWLAGGDMAELLALQPGLEAWARLMGCTEALIEGRRGWERAMKPHGYELLAVCLRKTL
jgi:hypothetical protein